MKTPGHAMTAQAGAVGCDVVWPDGTVVATRVDIDYADELLSQYKWRDCKKVNFLYPAPPAAVPVEALEGLVAELMTRVETDKAQCTNDDGSYRSDTHRAAWNFADGLEHAADKVYELIKERSNG